jgi:HTH-type transcriptional regulator / antitoxin HigA
MEIKPIKTEQDYDNAMVEIEKIWGAKPNTPEGDRLDILLLLVENFEAKHYPLPELDPIEAIKYEMEEQGINQAELSRLFGISKGVVSEVLNRKKPLTLNFIKFVHKKLGISADVLLA